MKPIPNFPDYVITTRGRVWSKKRRLKGLNGTRIYGNKWLHFLLDKDGYQKVRLYRNQRGVERHIHRLVLETFVGPRPDGMECRHLDGNKLNNALNNLCWGTHKENEQDAKKHRTHTYGGRHPSAKLSGGSIRIIRYLRTIARFSLRDLAWQFNISRTQIWRICIDKAWRQI